MKMSKEGFSKRVGRWSLVLSIAVGLNLGFARGADAGSAPAAHAPIGVMGDHTHHANEVMLSYRYMRMGMNGLRDDDERVSRSHVLQDFMVTPTHMDMEMHMFGMMYAPVERVTLMLMIPYVRLEMDHRTRTGVTFTTRSDGLGDIRATALVSLWEADGHKVHANLGIRFPTGSITEQDELPTTGGTTVRLPYPMQLGSGTFDLLPGLTYSGHAEAFYWGAQARGEIRLNENHAGYRLGNEVALTAWGAVELAKWVSVSLRAEWQQNLNIRGRDESSSLNPAMVPTADPGRRAAERLDLLAGVNLVMPKGPLAGIRWAIEVGLPVYERLDGPGLETDWLATAGVQYAF
ncbi:MAG TPA: transporter [Deltaproteobacteria bacterium]|nr:transporter [Deltaproteobacteria bacterium]